MRIAVKNNFVHALAELTISHRLQNLRVLGEPIMMPEGRKGLTGNDILAIDVARDGGLLGIVLSTRPLRVFWVGLSATQPKLSLRNIHHTQNLNLVALDRYANTGSLG